LSAGAQTQLAIGVKRYAYQPTYEFPCRSDAK
jgi:hypothetical protein